VTWADAIVQPNVRQSTCKSRATHLIANASAEEKWCYVISENLWKVKCQDRVQSLVGHHHILVFHVQRDAARHAQHSPGSADGPLRRHVPVVVDAPDSHVGLVGR